MTFLLNGGDPYRDVPDGTFSGSDLALADLDVVTGLQLGKDTKGLSRVAGLDRITFLTTSQWTPEIADLAKSFPNLERLDILGIKGALSGVGEFRQLKMLSLYACSGLINCQPFEECTSLEVLWISGCIHLQSLDGIDHMMNLSEFEIKGSPTKTGTISKVSPLSSCVALHYVALATKINDKDLSALLRLSQLRYLWLQNRFPYDQYEAILASCPMLEAIELHDGRYTRLSGYEGDED